MDSDWIVVPLSAFGFVLFGWLEEALLASALLARTRAISSRGSSVTTALPAPAKPRAGT